MFPPRSSSVVTGLKARFSQRRLNRNIVFFFFWFLLLLFFWGGGVHVDERLIDMVSGAL